MIITLLLSQLTYNPSLKAELKVKMNKERSEVLTAEQKKRLEDILKAKSGADK